jgi:hypothetical protein
MTGVGGKHAVWALAGDITEAVNNKLVTVARNKQLAPVMDPPPRETG